MAQSKIDRPISGDIQRSHRTETPQATADEFLAHIDALLALKGVLAVAWTQDTPYFNDGEPCEFGINEVALQLDPEIFGEVEDEDAYALPEGENFVTSYGLYSYENGDYRKQIQELNGVNTQYLSDAIREHWKGAAFENVALDNFGDHAVVIADPEGFHVEFYEHE